MEDEFALIEYIDDTVFSLKYKPYDGKRDALNLIHGVIARRAEKRWVVSIQRLGDVVKIFTPYFSIDYRVMRSRDRALVRMFYGYMCCQVKFKVTGGKVTCDHRALNEYFVENSNKLYVIAMREAQRQYDKQMVAIKRLGERSAQVMAKADTRGMEIWMRGVKNAALELDRIAP